MKTQTIFKSILTLTFFFFFGAQAWAQAPANGTKMSQAEAEPYLQQNWDDKAKLKYFSVDQPAAANIQSVFKDGGGKVTHVRMARGTVDGKEYIFTIGVAANGKLFGDYYLSTTPEGSVIGPCPRNCDSEN